MDRFAVPSYQKIMIIDDSKIDRYVVEMVIRKTNFALEVIQMESGFEAVNFFTAQGTATDKLPGLILLDVNMPEMNGFEFMEKFVQFPETIKDSCPVMLLTSSIHPVDIDRASSNKYILKFINKPLNAGKLKDLELPGNSPN
jgi:CheY-like chemotaxis protein